MRIVQWTAQERVDIPDKVAENFLVLGEFRRTARELLLGESENYLVRGFAVEPEAPPTSRIVVSLNNGGGGAALSLALGAENLGTNVTFGQLVGGDDDDGNLEGNAQQTLDFVGQPNAVYRVQMRFTYADGVSDNRAFWDPGLDSESISNEPTRHLPGFELRFTGAPSDEWIDLADVNWTGAVVAGGDITDVRTFALEGDAPYQRSTQDGAGAIGDFDRSTGREGLTVGVNEVYPALRALARQIQDIKGANASGTWDWFSRPVRPLDPDSALSLERTKSLRSLDTVTYTVGDGVTHVGDFNGASGVEDALAHLASIVDANRPERAEIVVFGSHAYTLAAPQIIAPRAGRGLTLTIRGAVKHTNATATTLQRPTITVDGASLLATEYGVTLQDGQLVLQDINFAWTGATADRGMFAINGLIRADHCSLSMGTPHVDAGFVLLSSKAKRSHVSHCVVSGRVCFYDAEYPADRPDQDEQGTIEHSRLTNTQIMLHSPTVLGNVDSVNGFVIRDCYIEGHSTSEYTGSVALIDARCASNLSVERCTLGFSPNENGIDGREYMALRPLNWRIVDCTFTSTDSLGAAVHAVGAGTGGAAGTGWAVAVAGASAANAARNIMLRGCTFSGMSVDAGGIRFRYARAPKLDGCDWEFCGHGAGAESYTGIYLYDTYEAVCSGLTFHRWSTYGAAPIRTCAIRLNGAQNLAISDSIFRGDDDAAAGVTGRAATANALDLDGNNWWVTLTGCVFNEWEPNGAGAQNCIVETSGTCRHWTITGCTFNDNGGFALYFPAANGIDRFVIQGNELYVDTANGSGMSLHPIGATMRGTVVGNTLVFTTVGTVGISAGVAGDLVVSSNRLDNGLISTGGAVVWGYTGGGGGAPTNLNYLT